MRHAPRALLAGIALLLAASAGPTAAAASDLDGSVAPAIETAREASAAQRRLQVAAASADGTPAGNPDEALRLALRDIALKACSGGGVDAAELAALPAPSNPSFIDGRLPEGLRFGTCAGSMYVRLGMKLGRGEKLASSDVAAPGDDGLRPAGQDRIEIPASPAPAPPPAPAQIPASPAPSTGGGTTNDGGRNTTGGSGAGVDAEEVARRSLERQNRELGKYDRIVRGRSDDRRRDRDDRRRH